MDHVEAVVSSTSIIITVGVLIRAGATTQTQIKNPSGVYKNVNNDKTPSTTAQSTVHYYCIVFLEP